MPLKIPFFPNTKDDTHCVQACLRAILKYYFPRKNYSFRYLDRVTAHQKRKWTWDTAMLLFLASRNFSVIDISDFSYKKFAKEGENYLRSLWTDEVFQTQKKYSNLKKEAQFAGKLVRKRSKNLKTLERPATLQDIRNLFKKGYIIMCPINPHVLRNERGYASHLVLITNLQSNTVTYHDPGLPAKKNQTARLRLFLKAMGYPAKDSASLMAVKLLRQ